MEAHLCVRSAAFAMGTRFEVVVFHRDESHAHSSAEAALREIEYWHARLSVFDRASFLSHINAHASRRTVSLDADEFALLALCRDVWEQSDGAFDPTISPRMIALGMHERPGDPGAPVGLEAVELDRAARTIRFCCDGLSLDLGGVAKGFALDLASRVLRECGIERAFIHGGTSSGVAIGSPPGEDAWRVALGSERGAPVLALHDAAFGVSSPSGRVVNGAHHIVDPRDVVGSRVVPMDRAAAVWTQVDDDDSYPAALCDAWSTALVVLGDRAARMPDSIGSALRGGGTWKSDSGVNESRAGASRGAA